MRALKVVSLLLVVFVVALPSLSGATSITASPQLPLPTEPVSGGIRFPDDHEPSAVEAAIVPVSVVPTNGLKAVAIVGDVGANTSSYKTDMDAAVAKLRDYGVSVTRFYYGDTGFTWSEIVAAAQGAHFLLYMGHGVYGGSMPYPDWVGGFYLGDGQFVAPDQIRNDLAGRLAGDSIMIFSHACFTAGSAGNDTPSWLPQSEAERRVKMYADPFTDVGMEAYFANNYYHSAAATVDEILADTVSWTLARKNMGEVFKNGVGYNSANFVDLTYSKPGYDLWLDGDTGEWDLAFVGIPDYIFQSGIPQPTEVPPTPEPTLTEMVYLSCVLRHH